MSCHDFKSFGCALSFLLVRYEPSSSLETSSGSKAGLFTVTGLIHNLNFCRLAAEVGQGSTSLASAARLGHVYDSDVFPCLGASAICVALSLLWTPALG